jgi:putative membrane protein
MHEAFLFWPLFFWVPFHGLFTLLVIILVLVLVFGRRHHYYYAPPATQPGGPTTSRSDALSILEGRYARGEIQREEYLEKKKDLGG